MQHFVNVFYRWPLWVAALSLGLAGCGTGAGQGSQDGAAATVEAYLQARVEKNVEQMVLLACPAWEAQARLEAVSFQSMEARLEGVVCQANGTDGTNTLVDCQGKITTTYQGEVREWSVSDHPYVVALQEGEWRMCGYGE